MDREKSILLYLFRDAEGLERMQILNFPVFKISLLRMTRVFETTFKYT